MRKHFCGHISNTSDFQTSSIQEASVWSWYYHSCSVTSLTMISDCDFGFFTFTLTVALYRHKALHILNTDIHLLKKCFSDFFFSSRNCLVFQVANPCVCIPERLESMAQIPHLTDSVLNSPKFIFQHKHRAREKLHWSVVAMSFLFCHPMTQSLNMPSKKQKKQKTK